MTKVRVSEETSNLLTLANLLTLTLEVTSYDLELLLTPKLAARSPLCSHKGFTHSHWLILQNVTFLASLTNLF
jgi:hypothetical protein